MTAHLPKFHVLTKKMVGLKKFALLLGTFHLSMPIHAIALQITANIDSQPTCPCFTATIQASDPACPPFRPHKPCIVPQCFWLEYNPFSHARILLQPTNNASKDIHNHHSSPQHSLPHNTKPNIVFSLPDSLSQRLSHHPHHSNRN